MSIVQLQVIYAIMELLGNKDFFINFVKVINDFYVILNLWIDSVFLFLAKFW